MGADAPACAALAGGADVKAFFVRKETKAHGLQRRIEGPDLEPGERCLIVEDVVTTGGSTVQAIEAVREAGYEVCGVVAILDRLAGGAEAIAEASRRRAVRAAGDDRRRLSGPAGPRRSERRLGRGGSEASAGASARLTPAWGQTTNSTAAAVRTSLPTQPQLTFGHPVNVVATAKRPAALLPAPLARTLGFALLAAARRRRVGADDRGRRDRATRCRGCSPPCWPARPSRAAGGAAAAAARPRRALLAAAAGSCSRRSSPGSSRGCSRPQHWDELAPASAAGSRR